MSWKLIEKTRNLLREERGAIRKDFGGKTSVVLIYPNTYYIGMSNLGFQNIYHLFNGFSDIVCERSFLPTEEDLSEHYRTDTPLFSLESQKPINEFNIVAFSISFESDYLNLLKILRLSKIRLRSDERDFSDPLVVVGGIAPTSNPEPIAEFIDLFIMGEAEEVLSDFLSNYKNTRYETKNREEFLVSFNSIKEVYVPSLLEVSYNNDGTVKSLEYRGKEKRSVAVGRVSDLTRSDTVTRVLTPNTEFSNVYLVEVVRGCTRYCKFCLIGNLSGEGRYKETKQLIALIEQGLKFTNKIGLLGSSISDHPEFDFLCRSLTGKEISLSISSIRFEGLNDPILELLTSSGQKQITLAPEGGSERIRALIGKPLREETILDKVQYVVAKGILNLKLYFLVGLPGEEWKDIEAIAELIKKIRHRMIREAREKARLGKITASISSFIPKSFTPFQWHFMEDVAKLNDKLTFLRNSLRGVSNVSVTTDVPKWSYVQAMLSRGDRRVSEILLKTLDNNGNWYKSFRELNINPDFYNYRKRRKEEIFPWDFINNNFSKDALFEKYRVAEKEIDA